jgi:hypothetical protein
MREKMVDVGDYSVMELKKLREISAKKDTARMMSLVDEMIGMTQAEEFRNCIVIIPPRG